MPDFTSFLVLAVPVAVGITKFTDMIRNAVDPNDSAPKVTWNVVPFALGLVVSFVWSDQLAPLVAAAGTHITGVAARILLGLALGAMASFWHEPLDAWSAKGHNPPQP